jgi:hypothetical protein
MYRKNAPFSKNVILIVETEIKTHGDFFFGFFNNY